MAASAHRRKLDRHDRKERGADEEQPCKASVCVRSVDARQFILALSRTITPGRSKNNKPHPSAHTATTPVTHAATVATRIRPLLWSGTAAGITRCGVTAHIWSAGSFGAERWRLCPECDAPAGRLGSGRPTCLASR